MNSSTRRAALTMVVASVFIAVSTFLAKGVASRFEIAGTGDNIHPLQITFGRFLVAWLIWVTVVALRRHRFQPIHWRLHLIRTLMGWLTVTCIFWAGSLMILTDATAISFLTPVVAVVLAIVFLGESVSRIRLATVAIMLLGAMVLLRPGTSAFQPAALIALSAAVAGGFETMFLKRLSALESRTQILFLNNSIGLVIATVAASLVWVWPNPLQWLTMFGVGLSMATAQVFFLTSLRDGEASYVVPFMYSTLIFAGILDYVVFGDRTDAAGALGAAIIVSGAVFLAWRDGKRQTS